MSSKNRPSSFTFLGKTYQIEYVDEVTPPDEVEDFEVLFGATYHFDKVIQVRNDLDKNEELDTTLHEIFHGVDFILDLGLTERQVKVLATAFVSLLETNPSLKDYINANLN